jgi:hypothetical protein
MTDTSRAPCVVQPPSEGEGELFHRDLWRLDDGDSAVIMWWVCSLLFLSSSTPHHVDTLSASRCGLCALSYTL